jgi:hypothetical protein
MRFIVPTFEVFYGDENLDAVFWIMSLYSLVGGY